jgi:rhomboid protease GluP
VDGEKDYTKYDERELVGTFGRMDPRWVPIDCARVKELLIQRGYVVRDGGIGPGSALPSAEKLLELIGSPHPLQCQIKYDQTTGPFRWLEPAHNDLGLVGSGTLVTDGISVFLSGRRAAGVLLGPFSSLFQRQVELPWRGIVDVESADSVVHFAYRAPDIAPGAVTLWLPDRSIAERLAAVLPKEPTVNFRPQLEAHVEFERRLTAQSPQSPITVGLVAINILVFLATVVAGADPLLPNGAVQIAWGSNFGPYTTDGEWWRLFTSLFIHFGVIHLMFNVWALASFGPLVERLYGSANYLCIYLRAGMAGSLASISWRPDINSAGASGAIFGILGALLAAQLRAGKAFPSNLVRPLRNSTIIFTSCALLAGFTYKGIDDAAHIGGLGAGFLIGLVMARPVTGERSYTRSDMRRFLAMVPVAAVLLTAGLWFAQRASLSLAQEGLYWRTVHWLLRGEHPANRDFNGAVTFAKTGKLTQLALADRLQSGVLTFWREANARTSAIHLEPGSPNLSSLQLLQSISEGRVHGYELLAEGLRRNDAQEITTAQQELKRLDGLVEERRGR